jgi:hypothetical protein
MSGAAEFVREHLGDHDRLLEAIGNPRFWSVALAEGLGGREVSEVSVDPVGTGQVASCLRVELSHDHPHAPASVVVKTASADPVSRATSAALRHGAIEVGFYCNYADRSSVRTPGCHLAVINDAADDFIIVLEDLADSTQGDQIEGMAPDEVATAVDELAALHASWWESLPPDISDVLGERGDPSAHAALLGMLHAGFADRYGDELGGEVMALSEQLLRAAVSYLGDRPGPQSMVHGDFRPDNLLVGPGGVAVVDWQTVNSGAALADLSYLVGGALAPDERNDHEQELLDRYRARLAEHGVEVDRATIEHGYRRYALDGLVMAIGASQVVGRTERGDRRFMAMAERAAIHADEAGTFNLI